MKRLSGEEYGRTLMSLQREQQKFNEELTNRILFLQKEFPTFGMNFTKERVKTLTPKSSVELIISFERWIADNNPVRQGVIEFPP